MDRTISFVRLRGLQSVIYQINDFLSCDIPQNWHIDYNGDNYTIYESDGVGAVTISCFSIIYKRDALKDLIMNMTNDFIENNHIILEKPLSFICNETQYTIIGTGQTIDKWFVKIWVIAQYPRIVMATYLSEDKCFDEINCCNKIINSFVFRNTGK